MGFSQNVLGTLLLVTSILTGVAASADTPPAPLAINSDDSVIDINTTPASLELSSAQDSIATNLAIQNYLSAIDQQENEAGPYDPILSEMTYGLGNTLQHNHRYEEAIAAYKRSMHLHRVNDGVYSLSQVPMLRGIIKSHIELGSINEASQSYHQLLWLHMKTYGENDVRLIPLMDEVGQWHLETYAQMGRRDDLYHLQASLQLYSSAIDLTASQLGSTNLQLVDMLNNFALATYYHALHERLYPDAWGNPGGAPFGYRPFGFSEETLRRGTHYLNGLASYRNALDILENNPDAPIQDKAETYAQLGDWNLLFGYPDAATEAYHQAHSVLGGVEQKDLILDALFGAPKMLPRIKKQPVVSSKVSKKPGNNNDRLSVLNERYVNVSIEVTSEGRVTTIDILKTHPENAPELETRVKRSLHSSKFRPRFADGHAVLTSDFTMKMLTPH